MEEFKIKLKNYLKQINIEISDEEVEKFYNYMNIMLEWNEKINLTAITNIDDIVLKHFVDCLTANKYIENSKKVIDVGTGAGFPGVPLAIINQDSEFVLVDSLNKRINFLNDLKSKINLNNVETIHSRVEDIGQNKNHREKYDIAVSRAVANMSTLLEYLLPMVKVGGKVICMKGSQIEEELNDASFAIKKLGGALKDVFEFCLPDSDIKRNIIVIEKVKATSTKYPRKAGLPSKQPLCLK